MLEQPQKKPVHPGERICIRLKQQSATLLNRALRDVPNISHITNCALVDYLTKHGYSHRRDKAMGEE